MPDRRFSSLAENTNLALNDIFASTDVSATQSKRVSAEAILKTVDLLPDTPLTVDTKLLALNAGPTPVKTNMQGIYNFIQLLAQYDNVNLNDFIPSFQVATGISKKTTASDILKSFRLLNAITSLALDDSFLVFDQSQNGIRRFLPRAFWNTVNLFTNRTTTSTASYLPVYVGGTMYKITPLNLLKGIQHASTIASIDTPDYIYMWDTSNTAPRRLSPTNFLKYITSLPDLGTNISANDYYPVIDATDGNPKKVRADRINPPNSIATSHLKGSSVTGAKIATDAVSRIKIVDDAVNNEKFKIAGTSALNRPIVSDGSDGFKYQDFAEVIYDGDTEIPDRGAYNSLTVNIESTFVKIDIINYDTGEIIESVTKAQFDSLSSYNPSDTTPANNTRLANQLQFRWLIIGTAQRNNLNSDGYIAKGSNSSLVLWNGQGFGNTTNYAVGNFIIKIIYVEV